MKLNQRLSNLLLLIQIAKIYGDYGDLFGNWNSWSPCPAKCMAVFRTRERYCIATECFFEMYEEEKEACRIPTCMKPPSSLDTLDGCIEKKGRTIGLKLEYRDIPESQKTLSLDFEMEFPIIYVVIKVTRGFQGIKLRYTQPDRPDVWYTYLNKPLIKGEHVFLRAANTYRHDVNITIGFFTVRKLEISLLQSSLVSSMEEKTWAALLWGCKRERFYMEFVNEKSISDDHIVWLSEPSKAVVANFSCRTNATRFYAEGMRIRNRITSKEVSFDSTKPLHVKVLQKTTNIYRGWNVISVNLNYPNADALVGDFNKVVYNGVTHYYGVFECTGKTELIEGDEYGMFRSGHIEVMFSADINECLMFDNCSTHAQCINTIGSFYCKCHPGYFGNGFSCYSREDWITNKRGVYTTSELEYIVRTTAV